MDILSINMLLGLSVHVYIYDIVGVIRDFSQ